MQPIDLAYLRNSRHGKNLVKLMKELVLNEPINRYELAKKIGFSYALVHKSVKELAQSNFLDDYGKRKIKREPWKRRRSKHKHSTTLWGLSIKGLWVLILVDQKILRDWNSIKKTYKKHLGGFVNYFDIMLQTGKIRQRYGHYTDHNHPNPKMVAQFLIFSPIADEKQTKTWYKRFIDQLGDYPRSTKSRIRHEIEREEKNLSTFVKRCQILRHEILSQQKSSTDN